MLTSKKHLAEQQHAVSAAQKGSDLHCLQYLHRRKQSLCFPIVKQKVINSVVAALLDSTRMQRMTLALSAREKEMSSKRRFLFDRSRCVLRRPQQLESALQLESSRNFREDETEDESLLQPPMVITSSVAPPLRDRQPSAM